MSNDKAASKKRREHDYFAMFEGLLEYSKKAIDYVGNEFQSFDPTESVLDQKLLELHDIEHTADEKKHIIMERLVKEFITPIEREDIIEIADTLDEVTDRIEELYQKIYMYHIQEILPEAKEFVEIITKCVAKLQKIYKEFHHFKKSITIHEYIIELNELEEDGDRLYIKAMRKLYGGIEDPVKAYAWTEVFDQLEKCCDICETAGNLVSEVIMKNS